MFKILGANVLRKTPALLFLKPLDTKYNNTDRENYQ